MSYQLSCPYASAVPSSIMDFVVIALVGPADDAM